MQDSWRCSRGFVVRGVHGDVSVLVKGTKECAEENAEEGQRVGCRPVARRTRCYIMQVAPRRVRKATTEVFLHIIEPCNVDTQS